MHRPSTRRMGVEPGADLLERLAPVKVAVADVEVHVLPRHIHVTQVVGVKRDRVGRGRGKAAPRRRLSRRGLAASRNGPPASAGRRTPGESAGSRCRSAKPRAAPSRREAAAPGSIHRTTDASRRRRPRPATAGRRSPPAPCRSRRPGSSTTILRPTLPEEEGGVSLTVVLQTAQEGTGVDSAWPPALSQRRHRRVGAHPAIRQVHSAEIEEGERPDRERHRGRPGQNREAKTVPVRASQRQRRATRPTTSGRITAVCLMRRASAVAAAEATSLG